MAATPPTTTPMIIEVTLLELPDPGLSVEVDEA
jgi:hypothetical protein